MVKSSVTQPLRDALPYHLSTLPTSDTEAWEVQVHLSFSIHHSQFDNVDFFLSCFAIVSPSCQSDLYVRSAWKKLEAYRSSSSIIVKDLFGSDKSRFKKFSRKFDGNDGAILFDYSKNLIDDKSYQLLLELAKEAKVFDLRDRLFAGEHINITEDR